MAQITANATIPDLDYEYHTVTLDSVGQTSANTFTAYLTQPLKNVVQARLLAAHIHTSAATEHCYVSIEELNSNFNDRASNVYGGQASISAVRSSFASLITDAAAHSSGDTVVKFKDEYPVVAQYIDPIKRVERFTVKIMNQEGQTITNASVSGDNFLVLRFVCRKGNL